VREGLAAANLLASEDLRLITHSLMVEAFATITESAPAQAAEREQTYHLIKGLKAIEAELHSRIQRKDTIERRMDRDAEPEADDALINDADLGANDN
jgi:hypothetical protein